MQKNKNVQMINIYFNLKNYLLCLGDWSLTFEMMVFKIVIDSVVFTLNYSLWQEKSFCISYGGINVLPKEILCDLIIYINY